jgi:DNA mismatch repair ATPase MutL
MPTRRGAFKNASEQYNKIVDVITKYSIHYAAHVSFSCKRVGQHSPDYQTPQASSTIDNIRIAYGSALAKEVIDIASNFTVKDMKPDDAIVNISIQGKVTNANYSNKKLIFILFINNRLVDCQSIRKVIESVYTPLLPKQQSPFVYLSLSIPRQYIDVNIHPTKKEVRFLFEEEILVEIHKIFTKALQSSNQSRVFYNQSLLTASFVSADISSSSLNNRVIDATARGGKLRSVISSSDKGEEALLQTDSAMRKQVIDELSDSELDGMIEPKISAKLIHAEEEEEWEEEESILDNSKSSLKRKFSLLASRSRSPSLSNDEENSSGKENMSDDSNNDINLDSELSGHQTSSYRQLNTSSAAAAKTSSAHRVIASNHTSKPRSITVSANKLVRSDYRDQRIDRFFLPTNDCAIKSSSSFPSELLYSKQSDSDIREEELIPEALICQLIGVGSISKAPSYAQKLKQSHIPDCPCCIDISSGIAATAAANMRPTTADIAQDNTLNYSIAADYRRTSCEYTSVRELIDEMDRQMHGGLSELIKQHVYVGSINQSYSLIQHQTSLYLVNHEQVARHLFYQLTLKRFQCLPRLTLATPILITDLIKETLVIDDESRSVEEIVSTFIRHAAMLSDYFSIDIDANGYLSSLPNILPVRMKSSSSSSSTAAYFPSATSLSKFMIKLATCVNWNHEKSCFRGIAEQLGSYYASSDSAEYHREIVSSVLYPAFIKHLQVPKQSVDDGTFRQLAKLEQLYKIFERC